jgi:catechol 2,3-dioxygenase-like lactoylglutathione lyase family enzyme
MNELAVHHLAVMVSDLAAAERFYAGVLGLPVLRRHDDAAGRPRAIWLLLANGAFLALEQGAGPPKADGAPGWHCVALGIQRADREVWRARLATAGFPVEKETAFTLYCRDPDGALVGLSHHPEPA